MIIAALDIGGTAIKYCRFDSRFPFEKSMVREVPTNAAEGGDSVMRRVGNLLADMGGFDTVAVSSTGQIDPSSGSVIYATDNLPGYTGINIRARIQERFRVPVLVENDVNAAALGEAAFGSGKGYPDFLCLTYGTGIGGAIVIGGKIYYGSSFSAAEAGHIITHAGGRPCTCGSRGCYEAYASTTALVRTVRESVGGAALDGRRIFSEMQGNPAMREALLSWIHEVMWGLISLIHLFNPACIVLGGGIMNERLILDYIRQNIGKYIMKNYRHVKIVQASLGNTAGIQGIIHVALTRLSEGGDRYSRE